MVRMLRGGTVSLPNRNQVYFGCENSTDACFGRRSEFEDILDDEAELKLWQKLKFPGEFPLQRRRR